MASSWPAPSSTCPSSACQRSYTRGCGGILPIGRESGRQRLSISRHFAVASWGNKAWKLPAYARNTGYRHRCQWRRHPGHSTARVVSESDHELLARALHRRAIQVRDHLTGLLHAHHPHKSSFIWAPVLWQNLAVLHSPMGAEQRPHVNLVGLERQACHEE